MSKLAAVLKSLMREKDIGPERNVIIQEYNDGIDDIDEYIVIVGKNHTYNLDRILPSIPYVTTLNLQDGKNSSDCVTLFQSFLV